MSYKPIDNKRDEFRRYLERTGFIDALSKVLVDLFHEEDRPENAITYVLRNIGDARAEQDSVEHLKADLEEARKEIELLKNRAPIVGSPTAAGDLNESVAANDSSPSNTEEVSDDSVIETPKNTEDVVVAAPTTTPQDSGEPIEPAATADVNNETPSVPVTPPETSSADVKAEDSAKEPPKAD